VDPWRGGLGYVPTSPSNLGSESEYGQEYGRPWDPTTTTQIPRSLRQHLQQQRQDPTPYLEHSSNVEFAFLSMFLSSLRKSLQVIAL
jgi:hypothetical protein